MRSKKFQRLGRMKNKEPMEIDITSLLDILVILLVFLLKSYSASELKLELAEALTLPESRSESLGTDTIVVQVNKERKIFVNNKVIGSAYGGGTKLNDLYDVLKKMKAEKEKDYKETKERGPASNMDKEMLSRKKNLLTQVNIVLDQSLPYEILRKVMHTSAMAGFPQFKFVVQGRDQ
ncbi:MAG: biopolymer transporter ExbD [Bacteriovoracaceae bacterium]|nr:biopolymer transporter ExbD [Bacteriovoracaceae bacterium]